MTSLTKRAVLISPSYSALPEKYWLSGTSRDVQAMKKVITDKFGFEESNIEVLQDDSATKQSILMKLQHLHEACNVDDVVFIYYSGHGVFLENSQDEGLLPTITTWPLVGYIEDICITGKDLAPILDKLSKKRVRCTMILDCCHSGQLYRITDFKEQNLKPRQFIAPRQPDIGKRRQITRADRGGWSPEAKDHFFFIAACTPTQLALEEINKGGRLTMALVNVISTLESPQSVSYNAFFRLVNREFRSRGWSVRQTPQYESENDDTVLLGTSKVSKQDKTIEIKEVVNDDEVVVSAGFVQGLSPGKYMVFDVTATADSFKAGKNSKDWLAVIDVNEAGIAAADALGFILERKPDKNIDVGCLAQILAPDSIREYVYVNIKAPESDSLVSCLKETNVFNVSTREPSQLESGSVFIITRELFQGKDCWVTRDRQTTRMVVPPIIAVSGREETVAENLCRYRRYQIGLDRALSPLLISDKKIPFDISFKVYKVENVQPFGKYSKRTKETAALDAVKNGTDIRTVVDQQPTFKAHQLNNNRLVNGTGDAFVLQVSNNNKLKEETVHICIMIYQFDGAIKALYPKGTKGKTVELRGAGDTIEDICRVYIPKNSLRIMCEPDMSKDEPAMGVNTLVLYASSQAVDYSPLIQTAIESDSELLPRGEEEKRGLSGLDDFLRVNKRCVPDDDVQEETVFHIQTVEIPVVK